MVVVYLILMQPPPWNRIRTRCTDQMELLQDMLLIVVGRGSNREMLIVGPTLCACAMLCSA